MIDLGANFVLAVADALALVALWKRPKLEVFAGVVAAGGIASLVLAFGFSGGSIFGLMCVLAWAIFVHGAAILVGGALILWKPHRRVAIGAAALGALLVLVGIDAFFIEPHWLEVTHIRIVSTKVKRPLKIAIIADLQTDDFGAYEIESLRRVMAEKPDLILLAGDYIQDFHDDKRSGLFGALRQTLTELRFQGTLGAIAVAGNCDAPEWTRGFQGTGVICVERTETRTFGEVRVTGLSLDDSFNPGLRVGTEEGFHIVVGHAPDFALGDIQADLLVAGHTHGGQVRLPFIGPLITLSSVPRSWAAGMTDLGGGRTLVVSRGIGMERGRAPRLRFLCRPELVILEVVPSP